MPIQSNVPSGISKPDPTNASPASKNGVRCHDTSCTCGRGNAARHRATSLGQKVTSDLFLKQKQEQAKYNFYTFMVRLLGLYGSKIK